MPGTEEAAQRCWCGHLQLWHRLAGVCRWCAKMELRHPQFIFMPRHVFATEIPLEMHGRAADAVKRKLGGLSEQEDR